MAVAGRATHSALILTLAILAAGAASAGCGGGAPLAVRIDGRGISRAAVERWATVLGGGRRADPHGAAGRALRRRALEYLITSEWLIHEAADRGRSASARAIQRRVASTDGAYPGGNAELNQFLASTGETTADLRHEAAAQLAAAQLRHSALAQASAVTAQDVRRYYSTHERLYEIPERRSVRITNRKSAKAADAVLREVRTGARFAAKAELEVKYMTADSGYPALDRAIAAARPHALTGPVKGRVDYYVFELLRVIPARVRTLREMEGPIRSHLTAERRTRALASFIAAWWSRWRARTMCSAGFVVQQCRNYRGPRTPEAASALQ